MANNVILGVPLAFTILSVIAVAARFGVRIQSRIGWDDWTMLWAVIVNIANRASTTISEVYHSRVPLTEYDDIVASLSSIINTALSVTVAVLGRLSITILLIRIFGVHLWLKRVLIWQFVALCLLSIPLIIITFLQETPSQALWDPSVVATHRLNSNVWLYFACFSQSLYSVSDITFAVLPTIIIWKLNMSLRQRVALIFLLALSLLTLVESVLKLIYIIDTFSGQSSFLANYNATAILVLALIEGDFVIIVGSAPIWRGALTSAWNMFSLRSSKSEGQKQTNHSSGRHYSLEMSPYSRRRNKTGADTQVGATLSSMDNPSIYPIGKEGHMLVEK
ncbi:hypothetical protein F5Y16DRAFT_373020 [Xylariaceae sp. FL0255]|nr:hypothetical protein F5Y16DRAFT_373020 [Xylariaceae sp. FL0255]